MMRCSFVQSTFPLIMTIVDNFIKIIKILKLVAELVMKTKLVYLVLIVEILNAILELN